ncbi:MAG TPA: hypothetical protein VJB63_00065 [Patescibacteria group bacterium]|nr:hypothetical protein [Patescibacteria group bacterium]
MPHKTKKQKIISSYRRKLQQLNSRQESSIPIHNTSLIPTTPIPPLHTNTEYDIHLKAHTHEDLKKTLILTTVVLAFEFLIFYANLKGYLNIL